MNAHWIAHAFLTLNTDGKIKVFGIFNFTVSQFELLNSFIPLVTNKIEFQTLYLKAIENGVLD